MLGLNVFAADTNEEAQLLFTSLEQAFINLRTGHPAPLPPPLAGYRDRLDPRLTDMLDNVLRCAIVGDRATIAEGLGSFIAQHRPDELMVTAQIYRPGGAAQVLRDFGQSPRTRWLTAAPAPLAPACAAASVTSRKTPSSEGFWEDTHAFHQMGRDGRAWH